MKKYLLLLMFVFSTLAVVSCGKDDDHDDQIMMTMMITITLHM